MVKNEGVINEGETAKRGKMANGLCDNRQTKDDSVLDDSKDDNDNSPKVLKADNKNYFDDNI